MVGCRRPGFSLAAVWVDVAGGAAVWLVLASDSTVLIGCRLGGGRAIVGFIIFFIIIPVGNFFFPAEQRGAPMDGGGRDGHRQKTFPPTYLMPFRFSRRLNFVSKVDAHTWRHFARAEFHN